MKAAARAAAHEAFRLARAGRVDEALPFAERAVDGAQECLPAHGFLASLLLKLGRPHEAERIVAQAVELAPGGADAYDGLASVSMALGQHDRANALYQRATQLAPNDPRFWYNLACSERSLGKLIEAEAACDRGIALDPNQYPTYLLRSELRVQQPSANHIDELQAQLTRAGGDYRALIFLGYALGKELDDVARFDEAFRWFATAAQARRSRLEYNVATDEGKLQRIAEVYTRDFIAQPRGAQAGQQASREHSRYIFIVGLPRSGTTLVERILTGLANARSNGETDNVSRALFATTSASGDVFERAAAADPVAIAAEYARLAGAGIDGNRIIEKLPLNYLYLGAIHRALPEAKLLLVRRSPLDSCFAMYRTLFAAGYPFSYDLAELGRYYSAYEQLVNHWRAVLGDRMHEIVYEDLVHEPNRVGRAIATHCELQWSESAIDIQRNTSVSLTASASQVRRPIYGSSTGRWRHYRRHLEPLIVTLRDHAVASAP
ncbi:MAG TPA: sulfotransferase [Polyangiaceae bacterium]|nr:sulfotransferase [Polyangiaceae bacterium]